MQSGIVCEDENECYTQTGLCDTTTTCVNTEGSFECLWKEGKWQREEAADTGRIDMYTCRFLP